MRFSFSRLSVLASFLTAALLLAAAPGVHAQASEQDKQQYYSLYVTDFRSDNYQSALRSLRWILENAPTYPKGDDRNYRRGFESYMGLAKGASGEQRRTYIDSALAFADRAVAEVPAAGGEINEYEWLRRRARTIHQYSNLFDNGRARATGLFRTLYEQKPNEIDPWYLDQIIRGYYSQNDKDAALTFLDTLKANRSGEAKVQELLDKWYPEFFETPTERIGFIEEQLAEDPENPELMQQLLTLYQQQGMGDEVARLQTRILESDPTPALYRVVAGTRLDDGEPQKAFDLFERMMELPETEATAQDYYNMGVAQQQMGRLASARTYFRRAINTDESFGSAYMAIGNLYAGSVSNCTGSGDLSLEDRAVYWLATDYYQRARSADGAVASAANQNIARYREYFPSKEKIFFEGWEPGQSYSIDYGCYSWIGETTTIKNPS
jgi:tetratricopeptide (TPR) repeat protein